MSEQTHHETDAGFKARMAAEAAGEEAAARNRLDVDFLLGMENGRRFLWRVLGTAGVYRLSFTREGVEPALQTGFAEGRRSLGLEVLGWIQDANPEAYIRMQQEALAETRAEGVKHGG